MDNRTTYLINNKKKALSYAKRWVFQQELDDFYQELILASLKEKISPETADIAAYSLRFVSFRAKDWAKKRKNHTKSCTIEDSDRIFQEEDYRQDSQDFLQNAKLRLALERALKRIDAFDREIIAAWLDGDNVTELLTKHGERKSHGHWRLKRARTVIMEEYIKIGRE